MLYVVATGCNSIQQGCCIGFSLHYYNATYNQTRKARKDGHFKEVVGCKTYVGVSVVLRSISYGMQYNTTHNATTTDTTSEYILNTSPHMPLVCIPHMWKRESVHKKFI